jgi:CheY-like chemotaxis protein
LPEEKVRILAVDDDPAHLVSTLAILEAEGYDVFTHNSAFGVTNLVRELKPQLVLLDVNMPGLSGDTLGSLLRNRSDTGSVPVVFYSSNDEDWLRRAVQKHGAMGYISKGDPAALRTRIAGFLRESREAASKKTPG